MSTFLVEVDLEANGLGDKAALVLCEVLKRKSCTVQRLNLSRNRIATAGARAIGAMLSRNISLLELNLCWNQICSVGASAGGASHSDDYTTMRHRRPAVPHSLHYHAAPQASGPA